MYLITKQPKNIKQMNKPNTYFTWNTKKTENGFSFRVYMVTSLSEINPISGNYAASEVVAEGTLPTRARAKGKAVKYMRYFKQEFKKVNA